MRSQPFRVGEDVLVFTKCGRRWEGRADGEIGNDLRPESIREECERASPAGARAHRPLPGALARLDDGDAARGVVGDDGRARRRGQGAVDRRLELRRRAARALRGDPSRRLRPAAALAARPRRALDGRAVGAGHGTGVLGYSPLASGSSPGRSTGSASPASARTTGVATRRRSRIRCSPRTSRSRTSCVRSRPSSGRRPRRSRSPGYWRSRASRRVSSGLACRVTSTVGRSRPISRRARTPSAGIGEAIAATGAGSDVPPAPPPHIRPVPDRAERRSTEHETRPVVDGEHQQGDPRRRRRVGRSSTSSRSAAATGAKAQAYAAEHGIERAHGSVRGPPRRRRGRRRLHLAPERHAPRVDDARARRGQARPLREAVLAPPRGGRGGVRARPSEAGLVLTEAFMYRHHPQSASGEGARRRGRRRAAVRRQDAPSRSRSRTSRTSARSRSSTAER